MELILIICVQIPAASVAAANSDAAVAQAQGCYYEVPALDCPSVLIVTEGSADAFSFSSCGSDDTAGATLLSLSLKHDDDCVVEAATGLPKMMLKRGDAIYVPACLTLKLRVLGSDSGSFTAFRTFSYEVR